MLTEHLDCLVREWKKSKQAPHIDIEGAGGVKKNAPVYAIGLKTSHCEPRSGVAIQNAFNIQ